MPPAGKAGCCKSDHLSSHKGPQLAATGRHRPANLELPRTRLGPQIDAPACTGMPISSFGHPGYSCFWQPRQDAANLISYLLIGATARRHRLPQAADLEPPRTRLGPQIDAVPCTAMPISSFGHPGYSCFWQPRQDATNLINLSFYRGHRYLPSGATGCKSSSPPAPAWALKLMLPPAQE